MEAGYLGVGAMGRPMAEHLLRGGHTLTVLDANPTAAAYFQERQCAVAATPRAMADQCPIVFVSLPTLAAFRAVLHGPDGLLGGSAMKILVNTCTVGASFIRLAAADLAAHGVAVVDCPISGGPSGASDGTLSVMVSGDPAAVEAVRPLLSLWGPTITVVGDEPGPAQVLKLTNNILFAVSLAATAEAFVMGAKGGLDPEQMLTAINAGTGANRATHMVVPRAVYTRGFDFGAALRILEKDVDLAIELGEELGVPMWVCQAARLVYKHAAFEGMGESDLSNIFRIVERGARYEIPKTR